MNNDFNELYLAHHGIKGQRWGIRRFQNEDGSLTAKGRERYDRLEEKQQNLNDKRDFRYAEGERLAAKGKTRSSLIAEDMVKKAAIKLATTGLTKLAVKYVLSDKVNTNIDKDTLAKTIKDIGKFANFAGALGTTLSTARKERSLRTFENGEVADSAYKTNMDYAIKEAGDKERKK